MTAESSALVITQLRVKDLEREIAALKADAVPREPTEAMLTSVRGVGFDVPPSEYATELSAPFIRKLWRAMYDAARAEKL